MSGDGAVLALAEALSQSPPALRGATLLVEVGQAADVDAASTITLARAGAVALDLLRDSAGPVLATVLTCPGCAEPLDVPLVLDELAATTAVPDEEVRVDGAVVRAPTTADLVAASSAPDPSRALRDRCVRWESDLSADRRDAALAQVDEVAERLTGAAGISLRLECPACGAPVSADVDLVALLDDRLQGDARRIVAEVATLAAAFGWSEADVLALPARRRAAYLDAARNPVPSR